MDEETIRAIRREYSVVRHKKRHKVVSTNVIELAVKYGVKQETIRNIALRNTYKEVE